MPPSFECTPEITEEICLLIAEGFTLRHIESVPGMPSKPTIMRWCINNKSFRDHYARAKKLQTEAFNEEIIDIADDSRNDWLLRENTRTGETFVALNDEAVARSKIRIEARKWLMGKMKPKKYGDSTFLKGDKNNPINVTLAGRLDTAVNKIEGKIIDMIDVTKPKEDDLDVTNGSQDVT